MRSLKKMKIIYIFYESLNNLRENKNVFITFVIFLSLSLSGIIITDSLIYSASVAAEEELRADGNNVITINFITPQKKSFLDQIFKREDISIKYAYKRLYMKTGVTSLNDDLKLVVGTEKTTGEGLVLSKGKNEILVRKSVATTDSDVIYLDGLPFKVIGYIDKKRTDFLDSLGLTPPDLDGDCLIDLDTAIRLTLNDDINILSIHLRHEIEDDDISYVKHELLTHDIDDYTIFSYIDAERIVKRVIDRFSLLTNTIYILLSTSSIVITIAICKRNFHLRGTEFAVKIIHGIPSIHLSVLSVIETIMIASISFFLSAVLSTVLLYWLSDMIGVDVIMRYDMLSLSLMVVLFVIGTSNIIFSKLFFSRNPLDMIKERMK